MNVAVLGTGRMGAFRAGQLARRTEVETVLVASRDRARAEAVAAPLGARAGTVDEVLAEELDAAVVSSSTDQHPEHLAACAERGLPILCEKPIALTLGGTRAALETVDRAGVMLQVAFQRRFDPGFRAARDLVANGALGTLYLLHLVSHDHEPSPEHFIPTSGGIFRDLHVHDFDISRWLTGAEVETVYATGAVREWQRFARHGDLDTAAVVLTLDGGLPALISGTRHNPRGYDFHAEIFGSGDSVAVGLDGRTPLRSLEAGAAPPAADPYRGFLERFAAAFEAEMDAFLAAVRSGGPSPCPGSEALAALRVAVACDRSRAEGRPIGVSEVSDDGA